MNREERIAYEYLTSCGYKDIVYEPDGNVPPDFSIDRKIGVEVRRLNENECSMGSHSGLEEVTINLRNAINSVLKEFTANRPVDAYRLTIRYKRPIGDFRIIKKQLRVMLKDFLQTLPDTPYEIQVSTNISVVLNKASQKSSFRFWISIEVDQDSGGWVTSIFIDNIKLCVEEKTGKIRQYHQCYSEWWLILVNSIIPFDIDDIPEIVNELDKPVEWSRIIIVDPQTKEQVFEF